MREDLRHGFEYIMMLKPYYREDDLNKKDAVTFFKILAECEELQKQKKEQYEK